MPFTLESELPEKYHNTIQPWFNSAGTSGFWQCPDGVELFYHYFLNASASRAIVISSGRVESTRKYAELIYDLFHAGYSIFIHDHRGQGQSARLSSNLHHGFVDDFNHYVDDFEQVVDKVYLPILLPKKAAQPTELFLLCHSMGSAIGALLVKRRPAIFKKAVFCSPMFGITPPLPPWLATFLVNTGVKWNRFIGKKPRYFLGQTDYQATAFYKNRLMTSEVRYRIFREEYAQHPELQLGGVTYEWLFASLKGMKEIRDHAHEITLPNKVLYSGADTVVANDDIEQVIRDMPNCESSCIHEAMHELFFEKDKYRLPALNQIIEYLER
ncbi:alpha/beta fold hydrolase [Glaciecola sp. MH2013]|uniref:alpha/beta fold hydrolase n=1 Tax=Glaciecola sp. MH2013 TaxID=2785524 RepID=UPI00189E37FF|nr:alpha/beta fold hydrolase [Glaciecola sp. MH2013]MBF7073798.1 alpha/beta fold hydrolase [Glaciecola sp. MH2013]